MSSTLGVVLVALSFSQLVNGDCDECKVDVCFVLHQSGCSNECNNAKTVIRTLVYLMDVGPDATQVGFVQFADQAQPEFDLDDHGNKADVLSAINGVSQAGGCLDSVRTNCFGAGHGERPGVPRLLIMLTDGKSTVCGDDPGAAAAAIRNDTITILVVGVDNYDVPTINAIANNVAANTFLVGATYTYGSVVTAVFDRFKEFCLQEASSEPATTIGVDCNDVTGGSGRLQINNPNQGQTPYLEVLCENGWMVILRRQDGSVNFTRPWADYRDGFGEPDGEFWAGLELMNHVTNNGQNYKLWVDFIIYNGTASYAEYSSFRVGPASDYYRLHVSGYDPSSTLGDSKGLSYHNNMPFTTIDQDHDPWSGNCARKYGGGGWWYKTCHNVLLTGQYSSGIVWWDPWTYPTVAQWAGMQIRQV